MRKRCHRTPYRVDRSAWSHAVDMQQRLTDDQLTDLGMAVHTSIERMRIGHGIELDWHTLAAAVQDALIEILERHRRTGKWAFHGAGYTALARAVELHEAQLATITRDSARAAMLEVRNRVDRGEVLNREAP